MVFSLFYEWENKTEKSIGYNYEIEDPANHEELTIVEDSFEPTERMGGSNVPWIQNVLNHPVWQNSFSVAQFFVLFFTFFFVIFFKI